MKWRGIKTNFSKKKKVCGSTCQSEFFPSTSQPLRFEKPGYSNNSEPPSTDHEVWHWLRVVTEGVLLTIVAFFIHWASILKRLPLPWHPVTALYCLVTLLLTGYPILIVIPVGVTLFNNSSPHEFPHVLVKQAVVHLEVEVDVPAKGGEPVVRYCLQGAEKFFNI